MDRILPFIFCIMLSMTAVAQDMFITADSFERTFEAIEGTAFDEVIKSTFRHTLGGERTFVWERTELALAPGWESAICDRNRCYLTSVSTQTFKAESGVENTLDIHVYTNALSGEGATISVKIYEEGNPDVFIEQKYTYINSLILSTDNESYSELQVYPNPTTDFFTIKNSDFSVKSLQVFNITGKLVARFRMTDQSSFDVSNLSKGIYFVKMLGTNKTIKTVRLNIT